MTQMLSEVLGTEWTLDADLKQIYAYAQDGYAKESLGSCVAKYAPLPLFFFSSSLFHEKGSPVLTGVGEQLLRERHLPPA